MLTKEAVIEALKQVVDPELDLNIWFLGLVYNVDVENNIVFIRMTFTTPFCPYGPALVEEIRKKVKDAGAEDTVVEIVTHPPWTPPEDVKLALGI